MARPKITEPIKPSTSRVQPAYAIPAVTLGESSPQRSLFDNSKEVLEQHEVAVLLGISPNTVRNWISMRILPFVKIGRRHVILKQSLEDWLRAQEIRPWQ